MLGSESRLLSKGVSGCKSVPIHCGLLRPALNGSATVSEPLRVRTRDVGGCGPFATFSYFRNCDSGDRYARRYG